MDQKHFRDFKKIFKSQTLLKIDISSISYGKNTRNNKNIFEFKIMNYFHERDKIQRSNL